MSNSRNTRKLDLGLEITTPTESPKQFEKTPSKEALKELYKDELNAILEAERSLLENKIAKDLQKKFDLRISEVEREFIERKKKMEEDAENFSALTTALKKSYDKKVSEDILQLHLIVVELTLQSITKILGDANHYKEILEHLIKDSLEKKSADVKPVLKVSESGFKFLKRHFTHADWISCIRVDDRLEDGQLLLDDGIASLYEIGFVNQLDILRATFTKVLNEHHAN
jgi:hypothetical protein